MAPVNSNPARTITQQALQQLDESVEAFPDQLDKAYTILGIGHRGNSQPARTVRSNFGKHELVLRWLFKRLQEPHSISILNSEAWDLVAFLLYCIPLSNAVKILQANGFLELINATLFSVLTNARELHHVRVNEVRGGSITSESSVTLDGDTSGSQYQRSLKRKRPSTKSSLEDLSLVLESVLRLVERLVETSCEGDAHNFQTASSRDHLRLILTPQISLAANMLASWLELIGLSSYNRKDRADLSLAGHGLFKVPNSTSILTLWSNRSTQDTDHVKEAQWSFSGKCLGPALIVTDQSLGLDGRNYDSIELLIIAHTIIPFRALAIASNKDAKTSTADRKSLEILVNGICKHDQRSSPKLFDMSTSSCQLFRLAIRYSKSSTKVLRASDIQWLEQLFLTLATNFGIDLSSIETPQALQSNALQLLLEVASAEKLRPSTASLRLVASKYCGLMSSLQKTNWALISVIFEIDSDIFLSPSNSKTADSESSGKVATLLDSLIDEIGSSQFGGRLEKSEDIQHQKLEVARQLLSAFVRSRNLISFLSIWQNALTSEAQNVTASKDEEFMANFQDSVWAQPGLSDDLSKVLETALIPKQIDEHLQQLSLEPTTDEDIDKTAASAYAKLYMTDLIVRSIKTEQHQEALIEKIENICQALSQNVGEWSQRYRPRVWRTLRSLMKITYNVRGNLPERTFEMSLPVAMKAIDDGKSIAISTKAVNHSEQYEIFCFLCSILPPADQKVLDTTRKMLEESATMLSSEFELLAASFGSVNTEQDNLTQSNYLYSRDRECWNRGASITGMTVALLTEYLPQFRMLKAETRQRLLAAIFTVYCPDDSKHTGIREALEEHSIVPSQLWLGVISSTDVYNSHDLPKQIISLTTAELKKSAHNDDVMLSDGKYGQALETILRIPLSSFAHKQVDYIVELTLKKYELENCTRPSFRFELAILFKFISHIKSTSMLRRMPRAMLNLALLIDQDVLERDESCVILEELSQEVFSTLITTKNEPHLIQSLDEMCTRLRDQLAHPNTLERKPALRALVKCSIANPRLALYLANRSGINTAFESTQGRVLSVLKEDLDTISMRTLVVQTETQESKGLLNLLSAFEEMSLARQLSESNHKIFHSIKGLHNSSNIQDDFGLTHNETSRELLGHNMTTPDLHRRLRICINRFELSDASQRNSKLNHLSSLVSSESGQLIDLTLIAYLINHASYSADFPDSQLYELYHSICSGLSTQADSRIVWAKLQILENLIHKKSPFINQWAIENAMSSILHTAALPEMWSARAGTAGIYQQFCRVLHTIFTIHLGKLRGRYHLVLPVLQILLARLFVRYEQGKQPTDSMNGARWMTVDESVENNNAQAYSRLLFALCEPSSQAASGASKSADLQLTPAKDVIRKTAGQHLPMLIISYCQYQLEGRLEPGVKDGLLPAIYAVFSVASQERLRAVSAAMNTSSRAVFKTLYNDYRRFGKWKGN